MAAASQASRVTAIDRPLTTKGPLMSATRTEPRPETRTQPQAGGGDHERFAHIIRTPGRNAEAAITEARVMGGEVEALCGKKWVPERDPAKYPVCPECKRIKNGH
jgi:hypothetical protein